MGLTITKPGWVHDTEQQSTAKHIYGHVYTIITRRELRPRARKKVNLLPLQEPIDTENKTSSVRPIGSRIASVTAAGGFVLSLDITGDLGLITTAGDVCGRGRRGARPHTG
jgi:hypothetical protein